MCGSSPKPPPGPTLEEQKELMAYQIELEKNAAMEQMAMQQAQSAALARQQQREAQAMAKREADKQAVKRNQEIARENQMELLKRKSQAKGEAGRRSAQRALLVDENTPSYFSEAAEADTPTKSLLTD